MTDRPHQPMLSSIYPSTDFDIWTAYPDDEDDGVPIHQIIESLPTRPYLAEDSFCVGFHSRTVVGFGVAAGESEAWPLVVAGPVLVPWFNHPEAQEDDPSASVDFLVPKGAARIDVLRAAVQAVSWSVTAKPWASHALLWLVGELKNELDRLSDAWPAA